MSRRLSISITTRVLLLGLAVFCRPGVLLAAQAGTPANARVIIFVIDGPRYSEFFGDPAHTHIPHIWNELVPQGTLDTNFRNETLTETMSGHTSILTGVWQRLRNNGTERPPQPTLFEYWRKATNAPPEDAVIISTKSKLAACTHGLDGAYGAAVAGTADVGLPTDYETYDHLIRRLDRDRPHLVMASFSEVDLKAHDGDWDDYVRQIEIVDSLAVLTWKHVQDDPEYANRTYMFITADHGRHDDAHGGFQNHGDDCDSCHHIIFLALGPGIRAGYQTGAPYGQIDICTTAGQLLGIATPESRGKRMVELFAPAPAGAH